jgi:hypothetical protein
MEVVHVTQELMKLYERMNKAITEINRIAKHKAESEKNYRLALSQQYLKLKFDGVSVTLIPDIAKGMLADLLFERDSSEAQFTAVRESISTMQTQASVLQTVLKYHESL